jgi:opacity protein-like surface antigen
LFDYQHVDFYPIMGGGLALNTSSFESTANGNGGADAGPGLTVGANTRSSFAYDLGVGVRYDINDNLQTSVEYLYTDLGATTLSGPPANNVSVQTLPTFKLSTHTIMFGLNWKM